MRLLRRVNVSGLVTLVALVVLWELVIRLGILRFDYIVAPTEVVSGLWTIIDNGELSFNAAHTVAVTLLGWAAAAVIGIAIGILTGLYRIVWVLFGASLETLRALPIVAFVPVAILLFGFAPRTELVIAFYGSMWPILLNTASAIRSTERQLLEVGQVLGLSRAAALVKLRLPAATPGVLVGLRLGLTTSLVLTLVAEMIGNPHGLGFAMISAGQALRADQMFAYIIVIGVLGILLNAVLMGAARLLFRGQLAAAREVG